MYNQCKKKSWWNKDISFKEFKRWLQKQINTLIKLKKFKITALNSGKNKNYKKIIFPKKIK